jgi:hypothetical protein
MTFTKTVVARPTKQNSARQIIFIACLWLCVFARGNHERIMMRPRITTFVVVKNPALPNSGSVMSEVDLDLLLDAMKAAIAPTPQKDFLAHPLCCGRHCCADRATANTRATTLFQD